MNSSAQLDLIFHGNLIELLRCEHKEGLVVYPLTRRASLKDIIESFSIPHTEIWQVVENEQKLCLSSIPQRSTRLELFPFSFADPSELFQTLTDTFGEKIAFLVDGTAIKLARHLRMLGIDTVTAIDYSAREIVERGDREKRILVSRNRELLQLKDVEWGVLLRSETLQQQIIQLAARFPLKQYLAPFTRCLVCNGLLAFVEKELILQRLEPLTKKYYETFKQCPRCQKIYWQGTHHEKMMRFVDWVYGVTSTNG